MATSWSDKPAASPGTTWSDKPSSSPSTTWSDKPAASPGTTWSDKPAASPGTSWSDKPSVTPTVEQNEWDWFPTREDSARLARDWHTERLVWRDTEDWTDWETDEMVEDGSSGLTTLFLSPSVTSCTFNGISEGLADYTVSKIWGSPANQSVTISTWAKNNTPNQGPVYFAIWGSWLIPSSKFSDIALYAWRSDGSRFQVAIYSPDAVIRKGIVYSGRQVGVWQHITVVYDSEEFHNFGFVQGTVHLYVNGVEQTQVGTAADLNWDPPDTDETSIHLGEYYLGGGGITGRLYDFALWDGAMTSAQAATLYNNGVPLDYSRNSPDAGYDQADSLAVYYRFDGLSTYAYNYGLDPLAGKWNLEDGSRNIDVNNFVSDWPGA